VSIEIRKFEDMKGSRPCRWCLGLQNHSVFADFDLEEHGRVLLLRTSFDGFGCCHTPDARPMDAETSRTWVGLVEAEEFQSDEIQSILSVYFRENSDVIWKDALEGHRLL
jgi:hypothetical protein